MIEVADGPGKGMKWDCCSWNVQVPSTLSGYMEFIPYKLMWCPDREQFLYFLDEKNDELSCD